MRKIFTTTLLCCMASILFGQVSLPYSQNFDTFPVDNVNFGPGAEPFPLVMQWVNVDTADDAQDWYGRSVATGSSSTGPTEDHTSGTGVYMFVEDGFGSFTNIQMESPSIDLVSVTSNVELSYWAHSQTTAANGNAMMVDVWDGSTWTQVDSFGILSTTNTWFNRFVDLSPFTGNIIKLRWRGTNNVTSFEHDIAIDDVDVYATSLTALVPVALDPSCNGATDGVLTASATFGTMPYSFLWSNGATTATINVGAGTYCVVVTDSVGDTSSTCVTLGQPSALSFNLNASSLQACFGDTSVLLSLDSAMGGMPIPACGLSNAPCTGPEDTLTVGTGTIQNTSQTYPSPFGNWYWGARHQVIFRANELIAAGVQPGLLKGLAWDVDSIIGTTDYANYEIKLGCTSDTVLTSAWLPVTDVVFPADSYFVATGWNWFQFATPYQWDGNSNLVVEICSNNGSYTNNCLSPATSTGYISVNYYRADNATVCGNISSSGTSNARPNIRFANCASTILPYSPVWSNGATTPSIFVGGGNHSITLTDANGCTVTDSITISSSIPVTVDDAAICSGASGTLDAGNFSSFVWSTGDTVSTITVSAPGTYYVTATDADGCVTTDSATVIAAPNPTPALGADVEVCADAAPVTLDAGAGYVTYDWNGGLASTQTIGVLISGSYAVEVSDTNGCSGSDTVNVTINPNPSVALGGDTTVCQFDLPLTLSAPSASSYMWQDGSTNQTFVIDTTAQGQGPMTYSVAVTDANGCMGSDSVVITVDVCPGIIGPNALLTEVYPNPTQQMLNVKVNDVNAMPLNIRLVDLNGRVVFEQSDENHSGNVLLQLDFGQLAGGMYYLHINNDNRSSVHRITIQ